MGLPDDEDDDDDEGDQYDEDEELSQDDVESEDDELSKSDRNLLELIKTFWIVSIMRRRSRTSRTPKTMPFSRRQLAHVQVGRL